MRCSSVGFIWRPSYGRDRDHPAAHRQSRHEAPRIEPTLGARGEGPAVGHRRDVRQGEGTSCFPRVANYGPVLRRVHARTGDLPGQGCQHRQVTVGVPTPHAAWPTVIVSMPFMDVDRPSIQLGLLKAIGAEHGFPVRTLHANLDFAARIGVDCYRLLSERRGRLVGDWLFSVEAFGGAAPDHVGQLPAEFADELTYLAAPPDTARDRLLRIRDRDVPAYLDALLAGYPWAVVRVVGFSSTFQQNTASFALARRLKERYPELLTIFGGANFDGEMGLELVRSVDCVPAAVIGEGDVAFPRLLCALATGADPAD